MLGKELLSGLWVRPECRSFCCSFHRRSFSPPVSPFPFSPLSLRPGAVGVCFKVHEQATSGCPKAGELTTLRQATSGCPKVGEPAIRLFRLTAGCLLLTWDSLLVTSACEMPATLTKPAELCLNGCTLWSLGSWLGGPWVSARCFVASHTLQWPAYVFFALFLIGLVLRWPV